METPNPGKPGGSLPPDPKPLTLAQKIKLIQNSVGTVKKKGKNTEHNYMFLRIEDAVVAVNKLMCENDLILLPTLKKRPDSTLYWERMPHTGGKGYIASMVLEWTLEDVNTAEKRTYDIPGEGYDTTDKGTSKAITSSRKQAIILIFNIPVGNDIEERSPVDRETAKATAKAVGQNRVAEIKSQMAARSTIAEPEANTEPAILFAKEIYDDPTQTLYEISGHSDVLEAHKGLLLLHGKKVVTGRGEERKAVVHMTAESLNNFDYEFKKRGGIVKPAEKQSA